MNVPITSDTVHIREVWKENLEHEFALIRDIVDNYPYIAMDTEYPGVVSAPTADIRGFSGNKFNFIKANVDVLKLIQIGLTFSDENGNLPTCGTGKYCVWQFNFCEFDRDKDGFNQKSIELLINSGIDFKKNNEEGITANCFSELLMSSGIVLNDNVQWMTFHSAYDFGYLLKLLACKNLPNSQAEFLNLIEIFFPIIYDVKHLMRFCNGCHGGLNKLAKLLDVERIGNSHQAGSDSLLTCRTFFKLKKIFLNDSLEKYAGVLIGLD